MYEVIRYFKDAQDNGHVYHEGDKYPRDGFTVSEVRLKDLLSGNNFQKVALIKRVDNVAHFENKVKEEVKEEVHEEIKEDVSNSLVKEVMDEAKEEAKETNKDGLTAEDIDKMPYMKLKSVAKKNGIPVEDREAKEIREDLKKELGV